MFLKCSVCWLVLMRSAREVMKVSSKVILQQQQVVSVRCHGDSDDDDDDINHYVMMFSRISLLAPHRVMTSGCNIMTLYSDKCDYC